MKFEPTKVVDCTTVEMDRHFDGRGFFQEVFNETTYPGFPQWKQVNWSNSDKLVLRGIHVAPYAKLVTCVTGSIYDVCVDLRAGSPTYLKWHGIVLNPDTPRQLYIPPHCGHAFLAFKPETTVFYLQSDVHMPAAEWSVRWDDPDINVFWPVPSVYLTISEKDRAAKTLREQNMVWDHFNVGNVDGSY